VGLADDYSDLYRQYLPRILNYMRLRVENDDLAQDLTAEVFERAVSRQHTLRRPEAFGAWLFRIARTTVAAHYRQSRSVQSLELVGDQPALQASPPEAAMRHEELARLREGLSTLSEREKEIIRLKFGGGLGNQDIAGVLWLRPGHVAVILHRALRKLRAHMETEEKVYRGDAKNAEG